MNKSLIMRALAPLLMMQAVISMEIEPWKIARVTIVNESKRSLSVWENGGQIINPSSVRQLAPGSTIEFTINIMKPKAGEEFGSPTSDSLFALVLKNGAAYNIHIMMDRFKKINTMGFFAGNSFIGNKANRGALAIDLDKLSQYITIHIVIKDDMDSSTIEIKSDLERVEKERMEKLEAERKAIEQRRLLERLEKDKNLTGIGSLIPMQRK
jgi:hypothetical protein